MASEARVPRRPVGRKKPAMLIGATLLLLAALAVYAVSSTGILAAGPNVVAASRDRRELGPADAKVKVVVYFDFQCPHCDTLRRDVEPRLIEEYVKTGKVRLEVRPLPLMGPDSARAAEAADCAADQGSFFAFRDATFGSFERQGRTAYSEAGLKATAAGVMRDADAFAACLAGGQSKPEIDGNLRLAEGVGLRAVPTVLISGTQIVGVRPYEQYARAIEESLAK